MIKATVTALALLLAGPALTEVNPDFKPSQPSAFA